MRIRNLFSVVALSLLMLAGCSTEEVFEKTDGPLFGNVPAGMAEYQFTMSGITPTHISYADTYTDTHTGTYAAVNMEKDEMKITTARALIFEQPAEALTNEMSPAWTLARVIDGTVRSFSNKISFLLDQNEVFDASAVKLAFFVVANHKACNLEALIANGTLTERKGATPGSSYQVLMENLTTVGYAGWDKQHQGLLMTAFNTNNARPEGKTLNVGSVNFTRPFARFDVKNDGMKSLHIDKLQIVNVWDGWRPLQPRTGSDADNTTAYRGFNIGAGEPVEGAALPDSLNRPQGVVTSPTEKDKVFVPGVFYAYPTLHSQSPKLLISGNISTTTNGVETLTDYAIPLANSTGLMDIDANTRYKITLRVSEDNNVIAQFEFAPVPWGEGSEDTYLMDEHIGVIETAGSIQDGSLTYNGTLNMGGTAGVKTYHLLLVTNDGSPTTSEGVTLKSTIAKSTATTGTYAGGDAVTKAWDFEISLSEAFVDFGGEIVLTFKNGEKVTITQPECPYGSPQGTYSIGDADGTLLNSIVAPAATPLIEWAPVNVGATEPDGWGFKYQWGRNVAFDTGVFWTGDEGPYYIAAAKNNKDFIFSLKAGNVWYSNAPTSADFIALKAAWTAPSDGTSHPCPRGWRLPTFDEADALFQTLEKEVYNNTVLPDMYMDKAIYTRTAQGVMFPLRGTTILSNNKDIPSYSTYLCVDDVRIHVNYVIESSTIRHDDIGTNGDLIRCVRNLVTTP